MVRLGFFPTTLCRGRDSNRQWSCTRLGPLKDALPTEPPCRATASKLLLTSPRSSFCIWGGRAAKKLQTCKCSSLSLQSLEQNLKWQFLHWKSHSWRFEFTWKTKTCKSSCNKKYHCYRILIVLRYVSSGFGCSVRRCTTWTSWKGHHHNATTSQVRIRHCPLAFTQRWHTNPCQQYQEFSSCLTS